MPVLRRAEGFCMADIVRRSLDTFTYGLTTTTWARA
jgi:hypothetical protein